MASLTSSSKKLSQLLYCKVEHFLLASGLALFNAVGFLHLMPKPRIAYLFSRYPVVSQTFCDSEMLALEGMGFQIEVASLNRPPNSFRHERLDRLQAEIHYPPPPDVLDALAQEPEFKRLLKPLIDDHSERYGTGYKPATRARNAWYFAQHFRRLGVQHVHVHFANRATHTALFLKKLGFPFSFTAHAQDFMFDLGSDELLAEMAREAEFVVAVSDFSKGLIAEQCPDSADKIVRIYNGIEVADFAPVPVQQRSPLRVLSIGRLIEFKGFQHLIAACGILKQRCVAVDCRIIGDGPMRCVLEKRIAEAGVADVVTLLGVRSQEEVKRELESCDVFSLASVFDTVGASDILPTVITEAMASHLPVVSTLVTGIPEMVEHGVTGLLVEPMDEPALADALATMAADPELRARMGRAGRQRADALFTFPVTAGVLGQMFVERYTDAYPSGSARVDTPVVYLVHHWKGDALLKDCPRQADGVRWIAESAAWPEEGGDRETLLHLETLPDASVVESLWLRRAEQRSLLEALRGKMGDAMDSTQFYTAARNAVYLADVLVKRGVRLIHAHRSDAIPTLWLIKQLLPQLHITAAIEENPTPSRGLLTRLLPDFTLISLSDTRLAEQLKTQHPDVLRLSLPYQHQVLALGPIKVKTRKAAPSIDRAAVERAWLQQLQALIR
jgi:glycosyltransferase involved in cell wall biosynthesis